MQHSSLNENSFYPMLHGSEIFINFKLETLDLKIHLN